MYFLSKIKTISDTFFKQLILNEQTKSKLSQNQD